MTGLNKSTILPFYVVQIFAPTADKMYRVQQDGAVDLTYPTDIRYLSLDDSSHLNE